MGGKRGSADTGMAGDGLCAGMAENSQYMRMTSKIEGWSVLEGATTT